MPRKPKRLEAPTPEIQKFWDAMGINNPDDYYYIGDARFKKTPYPGSKTRLQIATEEGFPDDEYLRENPDVAKEYLSPGEEEERYRVLLRQQHKKRKAIDLSDGTIDPGMFFKRIGQYFLVLFFGGLLAGWVDKMERKEKREADLAKIKNYYQYDPNRPATDIKAYPPGGGKVIYYDFSKPYDLTKDKYYYGVPGKSKRGNAGKTVRRWGNTTVIESGAVKIELEMKPEDILEQIDEEDILDYMDGNIE